MRRMPAHRRRRRRYPFVPLPVDPGRIQVPSRASPSRRLSLSVVDGDGLRRNDLAGSSLLCFALHLQAYGAGVVLHPLARQTLGARRRGESATYSGQYG